MPVWDPHCSNHVQNLGREQTYALNMCYKSWKDDYDSLLTRSGLQSLNECRKYLKHCYLTKLYTDISAAQLPLYIETSSDSCAILVNITYTSHNIMLELRLISSPSFHILVYTISLWNSLPFVAHSCDSLQTFKKCILQFPLL